MHKTVLCPLPDRDFDVTEVAVPWKLLTDAGHRVVFTTEAGAVPRCDPLLLTGVVFGKLGAEPEPAGWYRDLERDAEFNAPLRWAELNVSDFDALLLPGGHAPGMKQYLGSRALAAQVVRFWRLERPVAAICHGVLVLARAVDAETGQSVLHERATTCLPKYMEALAYAGRNTTHVATTRAPSGAHARHVGVALGAAQAAVTAGGARPCVAVSIGAF